MTEFRQGPFSALRPPNAPQPPPILPQRAKVRLAETDAMEANAAKYLIILQNISISSKSLHSLKLKIRNLANFTIKMIPPSILSKAISQNYSGTDGASENLVNKLPPDLSWISGPIFVAYTNENNLSSIRKVVLALKLEPFLLLLGCRFDDTFFTHEGLDNLLLNIPATKEPLHQELVFFLQQTSSAFTNLLSTPSYSLVSSLSLIEKNENNNI